jgi:hypothetical protein
MPSNISFTRKGLKVLSHFINSSLLSRRLEKIVLITLAVDRNHQNSENSKKSRNLVIHNSPVDISVLYSRPKFNFYLLYLRALAMHGCRARKITSWRRARKITSYYSDFPGVFLPNGQSTISQNTNFLMGEHRDY